MTVELVSPYISWMENCKRYNFDCNLCSAFDESTPVFFGGPAWYRHIPKECECIYGKGSICLGFTTTHWLNDQIERLWVFLRLNEQRAPRHPPGQLTVSESTTKAILQLESFTNINELRPCPWLRNVFRRDVPAFRLNKAPLHPKLKNDQLKHLKDPQWGELRTLLTPQHNWIN